MRIASGTQLGLACIVFTLFILQQCPAQTAPEPAPALTGQAVTDALDPAALVHRALVENKRSLDGLRNFIFLSDVREDDFGKENRVTKTTVRQEEIFFIDGEPVQRTLTVNGQPLSDAERSKQEQEIEAKITDARSATPHHREERQKKAAKALADEIEMREDVADGFVFTVTGKEACGAHTCVEISAEPMPGFKGKSRIRALLPFIHGTLTIDADAGQWTRIDVTPLRKLGAGIVYLNEETALHFEQQPIVDGPWVLTKTDIRLDSRLLWERKNLRLQRTNTSFRRFGSKVRIVNAELPTPASTEEKAFPAQP
jgi:hypothetical protein